MSTNLNDRAMEAAKRYLMLTGRSIVYDNFLDRNIIVFNDDDRGLVFGEVQWTYDDLINDAQPMTRKDFEDIIFKFFAQEHEFCDVPVTYDIIELHIVHNDRALIKHVSNIRLEA